MTAPSNPAASITRRMAVSSLGAASALTYLGSPTAALAENIDPKSASEQLLYCTTRIRGVVPNGVESGTGFFYSFKRGDKTLPVLITNNHVVRGTTSTSFKIHTKTGPGSAPDGHLEVPAPGGNTGAWVSHPDPTVDLCALPIGALLNSVKPAPFLRWLDPSLVPSDQQLSGLDAIEDIIMVGYPIGLSDEVNDYPIFRKGITASDPAVDFNGASVTLIDIACFPGSSGSPVLLYNNGSYSPKAGGLNLGGRLFLMGILYAGPQMRLDGSIEAREAPTVARDVPSVNVMINLGYMIKARNLAALEKAVVDKYRI